MSPVALPADRRFHRAQVKPARRRTWTAAVAIPAAKLAIVAALLAYAALRGTVVIANAPVLHVRHIVVHGNSRLSTGEVLSILTGLEGQHLLWTDLDAWRDRLLSSPWVRDAALRRALPSTVEIAVSEREPIAIARFRDTLYLVDERGVMIDEYGPRYADYDLPLVDGLSVRSKAGEVQIDESRAELAARVISSLRPNPDAFRHLSQIDVSDLHNAAVILNGDPAVIHLGEDRFLQRLQTYLETQSALHDRVPEIDSADLRFDGRIYVRPAGKPQKNAARSRR